MDDLNNFFAKRDKKKYKCGQFTTANEIDKKLQTTDKKREKLLKENNDEWNEYEERKKDYTGLKIQNTTVTEQREEIEEVNCNSQTSFSWKRQEAKAEELNEVIKKPEIKSTAAWTKLTPPSVGVYIPPHLRNKPTLNLNPKNPKKTNINIDDKNMFPVLSTAFSSTKRDYKNLEVKLMGPHMHKYFDSSIHIRPDDCFRSAFSSSK